MKPAYLFGNIFGHLFLDADKRVITPLRYNGPDDNTWESVDMTLAQMGLRRAQHGWESLGLGAYRYRLVSF
jgi:hypothetical protein